MRTLTVTLALLVTAPALADDSPGVWRVKQGLRLELEWTFSLAEKTHHTDEGDTFRREQRAVTATLTCPKAFEGTGIFELVVDTVEWKVETEGYTVELKKRAADAPPQASKDVKDTESDGAAGQELEEMTDYAAASYRLQVRPGHASIRVKGHRAWASGADAPSLFNRCYVQSDLPDGDLRSTTRWVDERESEYLPLYAKGGPMRVRLTPGNGGYVTTLRYLFSNRGKAARPDEMIYLYSGGSFNESYNAKYEPITLPSDVTSVSLVALISGHGSGKELMNCAEFCTHTHHFTVGDDEYVRSHEAYYAVGSSVGCAASVSVGVVPNQYGTWPLGRAGWCPGLEVPPWVVDVTESVTPGETVTISYQGLFQGADYVPEPHPDPPGGFGANVRMSSWLVYHR